ncbi:hypothetical protein PA598K_01239 [Paenibacillus sp. 598K]|nr:hypothetical protein PA598K_01239 [Paenibacillus sp. 598K]
MKIDAVRIGREVQGVLRDITDAVRRVLRDRRRAVPVKVQAVIFRILGQRQQVGRTAVIGSFAALQVVGIGAETKLGSAAQDAENLIIRNDAQAEMGSSNVAGTARKINRRLQCF